MICYEHLVIAYGKKKLTEAGVEFTSIRFVNFEACVHTSGCHCCGDAYGILNATVYYFRRPDKNGAEKRKRKDQPDLRVFEYDSCEVDKLMREVLSGATG